MTTRRKAFQAEGTAPAVSEDLSLDVEGGRHGSGNNLVVAEACAPPAQKNLGLNPGSAATTCELR